jgi:Ca2+-binding RTX toxin-like protein
MFKFWTSSTAGAKVRDAAVEPAAAAPMLEDLEQRRMLTTVTVNGTAFADSISVSTGGGIINVVMNGVISSYFAAGVTQINVYGNAGNDSISVGSSITLNTYLNGGVGDDYISGGAGYDYIQGSDGNDRMYGNAGNDTLDGWNGNDYAHGGAGNDVLYGYYGNDTLDGGNGNDVLWGEANEDALYGGAGSDSMHGGDGSDTLTGGSGHDYMYGDAGNDFFYAHDGEEDHIYGGANWDTAQVDDPFWPWDADDEWTSDLENAFVP